MTGFGDAREQGEGLSVAVEVRAVNNRYLKIVTKSPERYQGLDGDIERVVRESISRGTINVSIRIDTAGAPSRYRVDETVLGHYWDQLTNLTAAMGAAAPKDLGNLLELPGVVVESETNGVPAAENWPVIEAALRSALGRLGEFRQIEGASMERDLRLNLQIVAAELEKIMLRAPQIVRDFRDRILDRVSELLRETEASVDSSDLVREVSIFAERCDISEEILRLRSHLDQFDAFMRQSQSQGRKLEFLTQEMGREVNTIGSKANNVEVAHAVVEIKAAVERMREVLQNVE